MSKRNKGVKSESEEKKTSFIREIFGMAFMLFAVLALVCLITGDLLFYALGSAVQGFLLGVFGIYSFFVLVDLAYLGLRFIIGRPVLAGDVFKKYAVIRIALLALFAILHLAISSNFAVGFGEQISSAYSGGLSGFSSTTIFGVLGVLIIAPVVTIASVFGSYLLYSIVLAVSLVYVLKNPVLALFGKKPAPKKASVKTEEKIDFNDEGIEESMLNSSDKSVENRRFGFFFNEDGFKKKSRRELNSGEHNDAYIFGGDFGKKTDEAKRSGAPEKRAVPPLEYSDDEGKIDLRKKKDSVGDLGQNYPRSGGVSKVIPREPVFVEGENEKIDKSNERVYVVPVTADHPTVRSTEPVSHSVQDKEKDRPAPVADNNKKNILSVETSPFGDEARVKSQSYDDITTDPAFESERAFEPEKPFYTGTSSQKETSEPKDFPDFSDGEMHVRHTEVKSFDRNGEDILDSIYKEQSEEPSFDTASRFDDSASYEEYDEPTEDDYSEDENEEESVGASAPKTNVPRPRETYDERRNARPTIAQQTSLFGKTKPKFTVPEDDDSEPIENMPANYGYTPPPVTLLNDYKQDDQEAWEERNRQKWCADMIVKVIKNKKNIDVSVENIVTGPAITRYEISIPDDVSPTDIFSTRSDLSFRLETGGELRMYSIPYTSRIGIEVANRYSRTVGLKETLLSESYQKTFNKKGLHFVFGEDLLGQTISMNINAMPHLLVCGTTGSGKSVCLNTMLVSLLYRYSPAEFRLIIIDPKKVEFKNFKGIPHLVFNEILGLDNRALAVLEWAVAEMDRRYDFLADLGFKDIFEYNRSIEGSGEKKLPSILILIDEFAELVMAQPQNKKKIENYIGRLAQKARSAGISLICATQRASVNVITGSIKANIASRICFKTSSPVDSRVIIDEQGADKLLGNGDALYKTTEDSSLRRGQGAFISNDEVKKVVAFINEHNKCYYDNKLLEALNSVASEEEEEQNGTKQAVKGSNARPDEVDEDYKKALRFAITRQVVSGSSLRTVLKIGYNKSAAIIMWMEKMGYISPILENRMRKVIFTREDYEETYGPFEDDDF